MGTGKNRTESRYGPVWIRLMAVALLGGVIGALSLVSFSAETNMSDKEKKERIESLYQKYERKFPEVQGITATELHRDLEGGREVILVDVRKPEEQAVSMIPGAITQQEF